MLMFVNNFHKLIVNKFPKWDAGINRLGENSMNKVVLSTKLYLQLNSLDIIKCNSKLIYNCFVNRQSHRPFYRLVQSYQTMRW